MSHFLVIFHRRNRSETRVERIDDARAAMERLFEIEENLRDTPERGVVLLVADDEDDIRQTHAHYFETIDDLLEVGA